MERDDDGQEPTQKQDSTLGGATDLGLAHTGAPLEVDAAGGLAHLRASARAKLFGGDTPSMTVGRYAVVRRLGSGGMGAVYEAFDPQLERRAAVKMILGQDQPELVQRLIREARAMARLSHPYIAHVYEVGEFEGQAFIAMELIDGTTLREWATERPRPWREVVEMFIGAGRGLAAAHRAGIVHRDFKPDNVMVDREGRPRVLDFGLASAERVMAPSNSRDGGELDVRTRAGAIMGTPAYMAPEQFAGGRSDARTDQFAFAVSLFEALSGERPFVGRTFEALAAEVTRGDIAMNERAKQVPRTVMKPLQVALRPDPHHRYASLDALLVALERALRRPRRTGIAIGMAAAVAIGAGSWVATSEPTTSLPEVPEVPDEPPPSWVATSNLPDPLPVAHPDDRFGVTIHRLSNGLTVYISPRHELPRVQIRTVVRAGFGDEATPDSGVAQLVATVLQHGSEALGTMDAAREGPLLRREAELFRAYTAADPAQRAELATELATVAQAAAAWARPSEIASLYHELGIEFDFEVTPDATIFRADVPSNRLDAWVGIEAEKLVRPAFRGFALAAAEVLERSRRQAPDLVTAARAAMYAGTSRGGRPFGAEASLASLPFADAQQFHAQWYRPNNTAIVMVGDVDPARIIPVLDKAFGQWEPRDLPSSVPPNPRIPDQPITVEHAGPETVALVWPRGPGWGPAELELLFEGMVEVGSEATFLTSDEVVRSDLVASTAESDAGPTPLVDAYTEVIHELSEYPLDEEQIADAWTGVLHDISLSLDEAERAADRIASVHADELRWLDEVEFVRAGPPGPDEVQRAARDMFASRIVVHGRASGDEQRPETFSPLAWVRPPVEPTSAVQHGALARALLGAPVSPLEPKFLVRGRDYRLHDSPVGVVVTTRCDERVWLQHQYVLEPDEAMSCVALASALGELAKDTLSMEAGDGGRFSVSVGCSFQGEVSRLTLTLGGVSAGYSDGWLDPSAWIDPTSLPTRPLTFDRVELEALMRRTWAARLETSTDALHAWNESGGRAPLLQGLSRQLGAPVSAEDMLSAIFRRPHTTAYCGPEGERVESVLGVHDGEVKPPPLEGADEPVVDPRYVGVHRPGAAEFDALLRYTVTERSSALGLVFEEYMAGPRLGLLTAAMPELESSAGVDSRDAALRLSGPPHLGPDSLATLDRVLAGPADRERFEAAKAVVEERLRADWLVGPAIPQAVLEWYADGHLVDPRAETWRALAVLRFEDLEGLLGELAAGPQQVSIVGNRRMFEGEGRWSSVQWR